MQRYRTRRVEHDEGEQEAEGCDDGRYANLHQIDQMFDEKPVVRAVVTVHTVPAVLELSLEFWDRYLEGREEGEEEGVDEQTRQDGTTTRVVER